MRRSLVFLLSLIFSLAMFSAANAGKRVALVIGNSSYKTVPRLANAANDATMVGAMLRSAGFDSVTTKLDLSIVEMRRSLREFGTQARDSDVAVVFYAGHGIEMDGNNYLIPTDAKLETDVDVFDETFPLDRVLFGMEPAKQLRLIILDACRDNPFATTMKRTIAARAIGRGLARVEPNGPNTMIAFAAKAGSTALDGVSQNSPFALALVEHLPKPGLDLRKAFGFVRDDVLKNTGYKQEPYVYGSLGGDDVPLVPGNPVNAGPPANSDDVVRRDYELALQLGTRDGWNAYLGRYPTGFYADLARGQLNKITAEEARAAAAEKARVAEQEKIRLVAANADKNEQVKAAAEAEAADEARRAAEKTNQIESDKVAAAERARVAAEKAAAEKLTAEKAQEEMKTRAELDDAHKIASLTPPSQTANAASMAELVKSMQVELRRVGCLMAAADGEWNLPSQRSLTMFNRYAGTKFDANAASLDALDAIKAKRSRVCPRVCDPGYRAEGDSCVKIVCKNGYRLSGDNSCERIFRNANHKDTPTRSAAPAARSQSRDPSSSAALTRADLAWASGNYRQCMGARSGCYGRAIKAMTPEAARTWCGRAPSC